MRAALLALVLVGAVSVCGVGLEASVVQRALAVDLPMTSSLTTDSFAATFSGADADLSFEVQTDSLVSFTSGGGWINTVGGNGTFGLVAGIRQDGTIFGHLVYIDHEIGLRVRSTSIASFVPGCFATIAGTGDSTSGPVQFVVNVIDSGEPGTNDTFTIEVIGAFPTYVAAGTLVGGNIQAHGPACP